MVDEFDWRDTSLDDIKESEKDEAPGDGLNLVSLMMATEKSAAKPASPIDFSHSRFNITRATEVIQGLEQTFKGNLFPDKRDDALSKVCEKLHKDMTAFTEKVKTGPQNEDLCKQGAEIFLRMARLMQDNKVQTEGRAGGKGPADYNFSRALEMAVASKDVATRTAVSKEYAKFLRDNFSDSGNKAKADTLEDYVRRNSKK